MTFNVKKIFSSSKSHPKGRLNNKFTKLESPSVTTLGQDDVQEAHVDTAEMRKKAWDAKRARDAEEYLAKHGFVSILSNR